MKASAVRVSDVFVTNMNPRIHDNSFIGVAIICLRYALCGCDLPSSSPDGSEYL
jgi:hypothetical protein